MSRPSQLRRHAGRLALLAVSLFPLALAAGPAGAQQVSLAERIQVRRDPAMFTLWAWITLADTATDRSAWLPAKHHVRARLEATLPPGAIDTLRAAWLARADHMFGYHATLLALHLTPPPALDYAPDLLAAYERGGGNPEYLAYLRRLGDPVLPLLRSFHQRARIDELLEECARWYDPAVADYAAGTLAVVEEALAYLRLDAGVLATMDRVIIIPNLVGPPGTAIGPAIGGTLFDVESPRADAPPRDYTPHEFIHHMIAAQTKAPPHRDRIAAIVAAVADRIEGSNAQKYYPEPISYFDESLVRAITASVSDGPRLGWDNERLKEELAHAGRTGFVLVAPLRDALAEYERSQLPFPAFFEQLLAHVERAVLPPAERR